MSQGHSEFVGASSCHIASGFPQEESAKHRVVVTSDKKSDYHFQNGADFYLTNFKVSRNLICSVLLCLQLFNSSVRM